MPPYLLVFLFLFFSRNSFSQDSTVPDFRRRINIDSYSNEISISSTGKIWISNPYSGVRYYTLDPKKGWRMIPDSNFFRSKEPILPSPEKYRVAERIGLMCDYEGPSPYPEPVVYRTTDNGRAWYPVYHLNRGQSHFNIFFRNNTGKLWLLGESGDIIISNDLGKTWENYKLPAGIEPVSVCFSDASAGLMATTSLKLYATKDAGKTWKSISTPFTVRTEEEKVRSARQQKIWVTDQYFIVSNGEKLFYTSRENIQWKIREDVRDFDIDPLSKNIYLRTSENKITCLDSSFRFRWESLYRLAGYPKEIKGRGDTLYYYNWSNGSFGMVSRNEVYSEPLYSLSESIKEPFYKVKIAGQLWGMEENEILCYSQKEHQWLRRAIVPFQPWDIKKYNDSSVIIKDASKENLYIFNVYTNQYKLYKVDQPITNFLGKPIKSFSVSKSEEGCFHGELKSTDYVRSEDGYFETNGTTQTSGLFTTYKIPDTTIAYQNKVPVAGVDFFLGQLNKKFWNNPVLEDFEINDSAIIIFNKTLNEIRENMRSKERGSGVDMEGIRLFTFFSNKLMDSSLFNTEKILPAINDGLINKCFQTPDASSTSWCHYVLTFTNEENEKLTISHSETDKYFFGQSWYNPWTITIDDHVFTTRNLSITKFFLKNTPPGLMLQKNSLNALFLFKIGYLLSRKEIPTD